jgi:RHS repeat-associated protein
MVSSNLRSTFVQRTASVVLVLCLLSTSTPAAPQAIISSAQQWRVSLAFWFRSTSLPKWLNGRVQSKTPETQDARDARIARIEIFPKDAAVDFDGRIRFSAIAYDDNNNPIGGVKTKWRAEDITKGRRAPISNHGEFIAKAAGSFTVSAEANGKRAETTVTVRPGAKHDRSLPPIGTRSISTRDLPSETSKADTSSQRVDVASTRKNKDTRIRDDLARKRAHAKAPANSNLEPAALLPGDGWDGTNYWSADDPANRVGNPAGTPLDGGAGSGNFQFAAPIYSTASRGIHISLTAAYNSRLWNKAGNQITYDIDRGWPAPGWNLGLGKMLAMGVNSGAMIVDADGTRHSYNGNITSYSWGTHAELHTTDGSFINYWYDSGTGGAPTHGEATLSNGTYILYGAPSGDLHPTFIRDAQGNYLNITYVNNVGPRIQTIEDTMGRVITFHYDSNNLLTAITSPGFENEPPRTLVRFHYRQLALEMAGAFSGLTPVARDANPWVVDAIYYPGTGTGYWFGDSDSYSSYGMLAKVVEQRGMGFSGAPLNEQGTVTQGSLTHRDTYSYPLTPNGSLTDAPTYSSLVQEWTRDGTNLDSATTSYLVDQISTPRTTTITLPNGIKNKQYSYNYTHLPDTDPLKALDGLVYQDETYVTPGNNLQSGTSTWEKGAYDSPRPLRVTKTNELGQTTATEFSYGGSYNQVIEIRDYDYTGALLRYTRSQYENGTNYTSRHIFNLPLNVEVFDANNVRVSRTEYQYDGQTLTNTPGVVHHLATHNPHAPTEMVWDCWPLPHNPDIEICEERPVNPYNPATAYRGNLTQIKSYADALNLAGAVTETRGYDITGNMVTASTTCCEQTTFTYTVNTQYAYAEAQTRGSATDPYAQVTTTAFYDFDTGLTLFAKDANGRETETEYDPLTLRPSVATLPTGAHTHYAYDDSQMQVTSTTYSEVHGPDETAIVDRTVKLLNGNGQVRQEKALFAINGQQETWDAVDTVFNNLRQVVQQSKPYRVGGGAPVYTTATYDVLGRPKTVTAPDGSVRETFYNEPTRPDMASSEPGETTRVRDAWGREHWGRTDASGRLVEVVEPNPNGDGSVATGGLVTRYVYNLLGNLVTINSMVGGQVEQTRSFKYDSLGRLTAQKLAEVSATLNDAGAYVGTGTWGDVFTYDERSNLTSRTDARGVKTVYSYFIGGNPANPDPLNRLQSVSWDTSGFGDTNNPILPAATITYQYRQKTTGLEFKDITEVESVTAAGVSTESYGYDVEGRVSSKTLTLNSRSNYPFVTNYSYDKLDRVTDVLYPVQYGNGTQPRKQVHHDYDIASRLSGLTYDGQSFASNIVYNAASQTTSLKVGVAGANQITENYAYDSQTGLLSSQNVIRGTDTQNPLLDLTYDYANASGKRTEQLTKILNNRNHNKDRGYSYDALGRLVQATGGPASAPLWTQTYAYDRYGNRTSVTASGSSASNRGVSPTAKDGSVVAQSNPGSGPTVREGVVSQSRPVGIATGSNIQPSASPSDLLASNTLNPRGVVPTAREVSQPLSDSPPTLYASAGKDASRSARKDAGAPSAPQSGPPTFTDDPLQTNATQIKALHITELRTAINSLRQQRGLAAHAWQYSATTTDYINANPILEMRTALDQALGAPSGGYAGGLAQNQPVLAIHIQELRDRVKNNWNVSVSIPRDGHASLAYDVTSNRITTGGFEYDAAGNQVRALIPGGTGSQRYRYDAANRLVQVRTDDNNTIIVSYTYGDDNQRFIAEESGARTYYVTEGLSVIAEYIESGGSTTPAWTKSCVYLSDRALSTLTPNGSGGEAIEYHHPDRLGTRLVTNPSTGTSFEQVTLPFGTALSAESTGATNRRFTSYERSAITGVDYAVNRHYDSQQGRFTQVDPIGMKSTSLAHPQTLNLYAYVNNDPINRTDPDGLGLGSFFRAIGRFFSAVGNAIARVLNNRWVRIGIFIAGFLVGIPAIVAFLGRTVTAIINTVLSIYNTLSNIASTLQLYGMLLQGKFKEFGRAVGAGLVAAALATIEDSIIEGVKSSIARRRRISLRNIWIGVKQGFSTGLRKLGHNLLGRGLKSLVPFYGNFCSPGNVDSDSTPAVDAVDELCKAHDKVYQGRGPAGVTRYEADKTLFVGLFVNAAKSHLTDRLVNLAFGTRISGGDIFRSIEIPVFGGIIGYRLITGRGR